MDRMTLERMHELLNKEINRIVDKGDLTPNELENAEKAFCLIQQIEEMMGMEGYSETGYYGDSYNGSYMGSYRGRSMDRGRSPVTGRYVSREGSYMHSNSGHSIKDRMISRLEHMMDETDSEYERKEISEYIRKLEMNK